MSEDTTTKPGLDPTVFLNRLNADPDRVHMELQSEVFPLFAEAFLSYLREHGGENYIELLFASQEGERVAMTLRYAAGETPGARAGRLEAERNALRALLEERASTQRDLEGKPDCMCWPCRARRALNAEATP